MVSWARLGAAFLGCSGKLVAAAVAQWGECLFLLTSAKPQIWVAHLGHKTSDFAICEFVDRWCQKWMDDLQIHNSQLANTEIWDTLIGCRSGITKSLCDATTAADFLVSVYVPFAVG
jgi:hypothetical protein